MHDRWPELELPKASLDHISRLDWLADRLARSQQAADVRVMRSQIRRLRELTSDAKALEQELIGLVAGQQPRLLELPGIGA